MSFCDHCEGQRFDRARVLRALRRLKKDLRGGNRRAAEATIDLAMSTIRQLDVPHLEFEDELDEVVH